jgi:gamma-glutamyl-gamma-aminobutyrate hydrolase PuuD
MTKNQEKIILVVNDHRPTYFSPFEHLGLTLSRNHNTIFETPENVAIVVFTGGEDINPSIYGENTDRPLSARDLEEIDIFKQALKYNIPFAGICRGAQLLCALAGGKLVQDVTGHHGDHNVIATYPDSVKSRIIKVTSDHHQMQYPFNLEEGSFEVLACSERCLSSYYTFSLNNTIIRERADVKLKSEPDVVWYKNISGLGAQYHPEWMSPDSTGFKYFSTLIDHYFKPLIYKDPYNVGGKREKATQATG